MTDKATIDRDLENARLLAANLEGRRTLLASRLATITSEVAMAKARVAARPELDAILEAMQQDAHEKVVGRYSRLLSALASDILEKPIDIALDLEVKGGVPSLFITQQDGDRKKDIVHQSSGSLTNIVCMGLRTIATRRAESIGMRQFLLFDEPDCWMMPELVPNFFAVLTGIAKRLNVQIVIVTHHRLDSLGQGVNVVELTGKWDTGLEAKQNPGAPVWDSDDVVGLRGIRLKNFSSFVETVIPLSPGLNVIFGNNDIGKSRLTRAFRGVAYGGDESDDEDVRDQTKPAEVTISMEGGRALRWSRALKRNPVTEWRLTDRDGGIVQHDGVDCAEGGRSVPAWVAKTLGIGKVNKLDIQIAHQKYPVFLLHETASTRAQVLSIGGETGLLNDMITQAKDDRVKDTTTIRKGEIEVADLRKKLEHFKDLELVKAKIIELKALSADVSATEMQIGEAVAMLQSLETRQRQMEIAKRIIDATGKLPGALDISPRLAELREAEVIGISVTRKMAALDIARNIIKVTDRLPAATPSLPATDDAAELVRRILSLQDEKRRAAAIVAATGKLPAAPPALPDTDDGERLADTIDQNTALRDQARSAAESAQLGMENCMAEVFDILKDLGNHCPLCGSADVSGHQLLHSKAA